MRPSRSITWAVLIGSFALYECGAGKGEDDPLFSGGDDPSRGGGNAQSGGFGADSTGGSGDETGSGGVANNDAVGGDANSGNQNSGGNPPTGGSSGSGGSGGSGGGGDSGGSGGSTGSGGSGGDDGSGGTPPSGGTGGGSGTVGSLSLIDDFEDGDEVVAQLDGRWGVWATLNNGTGVQFPPPGDGFVPAGPGEGHSSQYAAHTWGSGFDLFAYLVTSLNYGNRFGRYDGSAHAGVTFWAKGQGDRVTFYLAIAATMHVSEGGTCETGCLDHYSASLTPTADWREYTFWWSDLSQFGWGAPVPFDASTLMLLGFELPGRSFDFWVDDIYFFSG